MQVAAAPPTPDSMLTARLMDLYQLAKKAKSQRNEQWRKNYLLTVNRLVRNDNADGPRDSEIYPILRARVAWMTDQEVNFSIDPAADPFSPFHAMEAKLGDQLEILLHTNFKVG